MISRSPMAPGVRHRLATLRAATRLALAMTAGVAPWLILPERLHTEIRAVISWDCFAMVALASTWLTILTLQPSQIQSLAQREDPGRVVSLALVVLGAGASLLAVLVLLQESVSMRGVERTAAICLALSAVALAWLLIHTVFTLRYAHLYFDAPPSPPPLEFPGMAELPSYLDFCYFAFVIGMTAQTADVNIRAGNLRRTALLHGVLSFAFNTAVVALSIGVLSSLLSPASR